MRVWLVLALLLALAGCANPQRYEQDGGFGGTGVRAEAAM
jgi:hypothetical protein